MIQASFDEKMKRVDFLAEQARMAAMTLPDRGQCIVDENTAVMDKEYFEALGEYSASLPTGTYIGKRWKRNSINHPHWLCSGCKKEFVGWASKPFLCPNACGGTLTHLEKEPVWWMGEYYDLGKEDEVGIKWRKIVLL